MAGAHGRSVHDARRRSRRVLLTLAVAGAALVAVGAAGGGIGTGPPQISKSVSGSQGQNPWYVSDVQVQWTVTGSEPMTTNGCGDQTLTEPGGTSSCEASNLEGSANDSVTVQIDTTPPNIGSHADITETTTNSGGMNVSFSPPSADDNVSGVANVSCSPGSGSHFPADGQPHQVSCTATNGAGLQSGPSTFTVTVNFVDNSPPTIGSHGDETREATSGAGATVSYSNPSVSDNSDPSPTISCVPASGGNFTLGATTVTCTAKDASNNQSQSTFKVTVVDTTPPSLGAMPASQTLEATSAAGRAATYATPTATDAVSAATVTCTPASGSTFPRGVNTVSCTAKDAANNTSVPGTFTITVQDTTKPTLGAMPAAITTSATSASGAVVSYTPPTGSDAVGPTTVTCTPGPGSTFPVGTTTVSCTAADGSGNVSAPRTFTVTVNDTTAPTLAAHANETREATTTAGAVVTYTAPTATDNVTAAPAVTCAPSSGGTFAIGTTAVTCTARDAAGNTSAPGSFSVIVVDTTPPLVTVPAPKNLEANGPSGSPSNYAGEVSATDLGSPLTPGQISCAPASGTTFALGTTNVTCTATDARGNKGTGAFTIKVSDTTPPVLHAPSEASFFADAPSGIPTDHPAVQRFLRSPVAQDIVDDAVSISHNAPAVFPMGDTSLTFRAVDDAGNTTTQIARVNVKPRPADQPTGQPALPSVDIIPPQNPRGVGASSTPGSITISWQTVSDAEQYEVYRSAANRSVQSASDTPNGTLVYRGKATRFKDSKVTGGVEYRYVIVAVDKAGNRSVGEVVVAVGKRLLLLRPARGIKTSKPPTLVLATVAGATYYNIQLFRGTQKILSVWPAAPRFTLPRTWRYESRSYRLSPGVYRWYAWPGLGRREDARYGAVMGESTFTIVPAKKATAKKGKAKATKKGTKAKKAAAATSKAAAKKRKR